jgi:uncharacterized protein
MPMRTDTFELEALRLRTGEGRHFELWVAVDDLQVGAERYAVTPALMPVVLDISRTTHSGYALRLRFEAQISGPCMRCLEPAAPTFAVDSREVSIPGGGDELSSPYVSTQSELDLVGWSRDALRLAVPDQILCRPDCAGLCPECGADLNEDPGHGHESGPDPRWAALRDLKLD